MTSAWLTCAERAGIEQRLHRTVSCDNLTWRATKALFYRLGKKLQGCWFKKTISTFKGFLLQLSFIYTYDRFLVYDHSRRRRITSHSVTIYYNLNYSNLYVIKYFFQDLQDLNKKLFFVTLLMCNINFLCTLYFNRFWSHCSLKVNFSTYFFPFQ